MSSEEEIKRGFRALENESLEEAAASFIKIPSGDKNYPMACKGLGSALLRLGRLQEALGYLQTAHMALPEDGEILVDGADVARLMGNLEVAEDTYREAGKLGADEFRIKFGVASIHEARKEWLKASEIWSSLCEDRPNDALILHNLGCTLHELGETDLAVEKLKSALRVLPNLNTQIALATLAPHAGACDFEDVKRIRQELARTLTEEEGNPADCMRQIDRGAESIKIGYVSAFFHKHNWMKPVWAMLNNHDRERFDVHLFADASIDEIDSASGYNKHDSDKVFDTRLLNNRKLAELIERHSIDVLVDFNSYSATERLGLWVSKPAPVSLAWFALYATSGLPGIEWIVGDDIVIRPEEEVHYTEKVMRLTQSWLSFEVAYGTPDITLRDESSRFVFGCLGSGYKITPEVRSAWIKLLKEVPDSEMLVRNKVLGEADHRARFLKFFTDNGIDEARVTLMGPAEHHEFLATYGKVDLTLDTFPYNGGTTTGESLWQGVPVVCFDGDRFISRTSATIMHSGNLDQFIGGDVDEYIQIAKNWARPEKRSELNRIRTGMRDHLRSSAVCNGKTLAGSFEAIIEELVAKHS